MQRIDHTERPRVTFDTNVWTRMVLPERWAAHPKHSYFANLQQALRSSRIEGYICESFATAEAIGKRNQAKYFLENVPAVEVKSTQHGGSAFSMSVEIKARHHQHPGLGEQFEAELTAALELGVKILSTPYIGLSVPDRLRNNPQYYAEEVFASSAYDERFGEVISSVKSRGVGPEALPSLAKSFTEQLDGPRPPEWSDREFLYRVYEYARMYRTKELRLIEEAFAESADGDLVAAHVAYGNDYLCTEDYAKGTHCRSVFDAQNRAWLTEEHGVQIVGTEELCQLLLRTA